METLLSPVFTYFPSINCPVGSSNYLSNIEFVPYSVSMHDNFINKIEVTSSILALGPSKLFVF